MSCAEAMRCVLVDDVLHPLHRLDHVEHAHLAVGLRAERLGSFEEGAAQELQGAANGHERRERAQQDGMAAERLPNVLGQGRQRASNVRRGRRAVLAVRPLVRDVRSRSRQRTPDGARGQRRIRCR
jgi:hypothetical protein